MDVSFQPLETNVVLVRLEGRLDANTSPDVKAALQKLVEDGYSKIIIDLHHVPFIDSSGLAVLVSGLRLAREKGGNVALSGVQSQAQIVFRLTMFDRIFVICSTIEEAKQSLI
jgi:anti-sigma B factor antagonist